MFWDRTQLPGVWVIMVEMTDPIRMDILNSCFWKHWILFLLK